ncbi:serine/arginine repetitive matrix protein 2 isoform X2 [Conger conger]|uniref:serine/arginine repetitive matrix protein 2 isoform X2 n=1 Tax=Conger conger TaxID=82655 RepID=UPI002A59CC4D|nr:serine/arginine repetitive matrix protein 2 isoform X2 [Conger conger]
MESWHIEDDRLHFPRSMPLSFSLYEREVPNRVEIFDITSIPGCRTAISETTCLCDIFGDDCESPSPSCSPPSGSLAKAERGKFTPADDTPNGSSGPYHAANGHEQLSDSSDTFEDSQEALTPVPLLTVSLPEARGASPLSKPNGTDLPSNPPATLSSAQSKGTAPLPRSVAPVSLSPEPRSINITPNHSTATSHNPGIEFPSLETSCSGLSSEHRSNNIPPKSVTAPPYKCRDTAPSPEPRDTDTFYETATTPTPVDWDILHTTDPRGRQPWITATKPEPRSTPQELQARVTPSILEPSVASLKTQSSANPVEIEFSIEIPEPRHTSPELEPRATHPESCPRAKSPELKPITKLEPSAPLPEPESRAIPSKLESNFTSIEPAPRAKSPEIKPSAIYPRKDLSTTLLEPEPRGRLPAQEFGNPSPEPERSATSSEPEFRTPSPEPEPSTTYSQLESRDISSKLENSFTSLEPEPRGKSPGIKTRSTSKFESSGRSPEPESRAFAYKLEPRFTSLDGSGDESPEIKPSAIYPKLSATWPESEHSGRLPEPEFKTSSPEPELGDRSPEPEFRNPSPDPELSNTSSEAEFRTPSPEHSGRSPEPESRALSYKLEPSFTSLEPEPRGKSPEIKPNAISPQKELSAILPEQEPHGRFSEPGFRNPSPEPERSSTSSEPEFRTPSPEPHTTSPEPDPRIKSSEIKPSAISPQKELSATSPEPEFRTPSPEPELSGRSREPEFSNPSPEPELSGRSPEPEFRNPSPEHSTTSSESEFRTPPQELGSPKPEPRSTFPELNTIHPSPEGRISANSPKPRRSEVSVEPKDTATLAQSKETVIFPETTTTETRASGLIQDSRTTDPSHGPRQTNPSPELRSTSLSLESKTAPHGLETRCFITSPESTILSHGQQNSESESRYPTMSAESKNSGTAVVLELKDQDNLHKPTAEPSYTRCPPKPCDKEAGRVTVVQANSSATEGLQSAQPLFASGADLIRPPGTQKSKAVSCPHEPEMSTSGESPTVHPRQGGSQPHWDKGLREGEEEEEEHKREELGGDEGEGNREKASYREQQVELSFSARNRRAPVSPSSAATCRELRTGMPAGCYSDCLLVTQQRQQQNPLRLHNSQRENQACARKPRLVPRPTRSSASRPAPEYSSEISSMGSELDEADNEVKWFTDVAFRSLSSPQADYLDVYNSSHRSSTNVSQLSTEDSPRASAWSAYADLRGSTRYEGDSLPHQPPTGLAPNRPDVTRRFEMGSFECVDVALESREDFRRGKRTVPKRQIQLKRRDTSESQCSENDDAANEAAPAQRLSRDVLVRQHSTPAAIQEQSYKEVKPEPSDRKQKLQKSLSLDETSSKNKTASCLIKSVLSKKMQHNPNLTSSHPSLQTEDSSTSVGKNVPPEGSQSVRETPKMSGELPSDCSLSEEELPLQLEPAPQSSPVKRHRSFDPRPQPKPVCRHSYSPLQSGASSVEFQKNNIGKQGMRSELVVPFESAPMEKHSGRETWKQSTRETEKQWSKEKEEKGDKEMEKQSNKEIEKQSYSEWQRSNRGTEKQRGRDGVKQQTNENLCKKHSGDSANAISRNTAVTRAPVTPSGMTNRIQECYTRSENYKQQSARNIFMSKTPEIMLKTCTTRETKKSSLQIDCLPGDSEPKQEERRVAPSPEGPPEKEMHNYKMEKTDGHTENGEVFEKNKPKGPVHKVRDVRKLVKNTYNLSFKASAVLAQDSISQAAVLAQDSISRAAVEKPPPMQIEYISRKVEGPVASRPGERQAAGKKLVSSQEPTQVSGQVRSQEPTRVSAWTHQQVSPQVSVQVRAQEPTQVSAWVRSQELTQVSAQVRSQEPTQVSARRHSKGLPQVPAQVPSQEPTQVSGQVPSQEPTQVPQMSAQVHPQVSPQVSPPVSVQVGSQESTQEPVQVHSQEPTQGSTQKVTQTTSLLITPRGCLAEAGAVDTVATETNNAAVSQSDGHVDKVSRGGTRHPKLGSTPKLPSKDREVSTLMYLQNGPSEGGLEPGALPPIGLTATNCSRSVSMLLKEKGFQADIGVCDAPADEPNAAPKHINKLEVPLQTCSTEEAPSEPSDPVPPPARTSPSAATPLMDPGEERHPRNPTPPESRGVNLERTSLKARENNTRAKDTSPSSPQTPVAPSATSSNKLTDVKTVSTCTRKTVVAATGSTTSSCGQQPASAATELQSDTQTSTVLATSSKTIRPALSPTSRHKQKPLSPSNLQQPNLTHSDTQEQVVSSCSSSCSQSSLSTTTQSPSSPQQPAISITSTKRAESGSQRYYASDDPPSYDERESFSPLLLTDLYNRKPNRYHPPIQAPPCSCVPVHAPPDLTPPAPGPTIVPAPSSHAQAPPSLAAPPPARHHHHQQQRSDARSLSYKPGSPNAVQPNLAQPSHMYQSLQHPPPGLPAFPPPLQQPRPDISRGQPPPGPPADRRSGHHRSPQQPASLSGSSTYSSHSTTSPGVPPLDVRPQYLCSPQGFVSPYGSEFGSEGGGGGGMMYPEGGGGLGYGQNQRRVLLDPETGKYFYIEVPMQPLRKMLFDPETGQYVEVLIPQQTLPHSGMYPPVAAPYPSMHNPGMYAPQYLPYSVPSHSQPPSPRHPDAPPPQGIHQNSGGFGTPRTQTPKSESQNHPPLDQSYLESMYYIPTGMTASPNPAPPEFYQKLPPSLPNSGGKRS